MLAQQIVACVATGDDWKVPELHDMVRRAYPFAELDRKLLDNVLDMLDGRYPSEEFAELRPRIVWDRVEDVIRARQGARQLAITNAGTIPDRGLFGVHLPDGRRVGELDEEMVYEARAGQTFMLGASTWRIEEITRDRVLVTPAPGAPGAIPFWRGDMVGRPAELGKALGEFSRTAVDKKPAELAKEYGLEERAANNLVTYLREQRRPRASCRATGRSSIERFRDEIGDWRLCVLSPYGGRVHAAWGLALAARIRDEFGLEADAIWSDDGIVVHLPDADEPPSAELVMVEPDEVEDLVVRELGNSALFGARFRENAARALLLPRAYPGKRTPLWQQRLKAQSLLEVAKRYGQFPIVLETYRECLQDVFDLPALKDLLRGLHTRELSLVEVETPRSSPFASSLLFDYVATYMYEGDTPNAERRAAALSLDRELLAELLGQEELRDLIDAEALADVEADLQRLSERTQAVNADGAHDILRALGDLTLDEVQARCHRGVSAKRILDGLAAERRAVSRCGSAARSASSRPRTPACTATRSAPFRPAGCPRRSSSRSRSRSSGSSAATRARTARSRPATSRPGTASTPAPVLRELERERRAGPRRASPRRPRARVVRPRRPPAAAAGVARDAAQGGRGCRAEAARALPAGVAGHRLRAARRRRDRPPARGARPAAGRRAHARDVGARRAAAPARQLVAHLARPALLGRRGRLDRRGCARPQLGARRALLPRRRALARPADESRRRTRGPHHDAIRERLTARRGVLVGPARGSRRGRDGRAPGGAVGPRLGGRGHERRVGAAARPAAHGRARSERAAGARFAKRRRPGAPQVQGRWSLTAPLFADQPAYGPRMRAQAELLLERYGIVTRETVLAEGVPGGFSTLYGELTNLETLGTARRGYFVEGLGGAQFALAGAVERLRGLRSDEPAGALVLAATDPANPYGASLPWPRRDEDQRRRPARVAGAYVVLLDAEPVLYVERGGKGLVPLREPDESWLREALEALAEHVRRGRLKRLALERFDGEPIVGSPVEDLLVELGFRQGPRKLTLSA